MAALDMDLYEFEGEEKPETEPVGRLARFRHRFICREVSAYAANIYEHVPRYWAVAYHSVSHSRIVLAPFPLNLLMGVVTWLHRRVLVAPIADTSFADRIIRRYADKLIAEKRAEMNAERAENYAELRRGKAAEMLLAQAMDELARRGVAFNGTVDASHYDDMETKYSVKVDECDYDIHTFKYEGGVRGPAPVDPAEPLDLSALCVPSAYEQQEHDEF